MLFGLISYCRAMQTPQNTITTLEKFGNNPQGNYRDVVSVDYAGVFIDRAIKPLAKIALEPDL